MTTTIRDRVAGLFPRRQEVPAEHFLDEYERGATYLLDGRVETWGGPTTEVRSAICLADDDGELERHRIGFHADLSTEVALQAMAAATRAWNQGRGEWPTMSTRARIECIEDFLGRMSATRAEVVRLLMWEIGKSYRDAGKEFDRTVEYIADTVGALKELDRAGSHFQLESGILAMIRRAPLGRVLCMGPFNYPLNENFTTLIPALIMGNTAVVKLPRFGMLANLPLLDAFAAAFPPGVVNVLNGSGRQIATPLMESGDVDVLAFIGSSRVSDVLKKSHPAPHRLRCVLGLDAKNPAVILPDADLDVAVTGCVSGALSYNGQRCTAIKMIFVHRRVADKFLARLVDAIEGLRFGMPWEDVDLTPLPEPDKPERLAQWVEDAHQKGAETLNPSGLATRGSFVFPAVVYPVDRAMKLYHEEQFGPVVPVARYDDLDEVFAYFAECKYGQQASLFGHDPIVIGRLIDALANQVCRINLNTKCQRGPDAYPFTGRKDSAEGTLSVTDALRVFSIRSMVAARYEPDGKELIGQILTQRSSRFLRTDYLL